MELKDIIYNKWIKCSDDNYWQSEHDIVLCPIGGEVYMFTVNDCPYGWNVLTEMGAQFFTVEYPKEIKEYIGFSSKTYVAENIIKPLIKVGMLKYTNNKSINARNKK